MTKQTVRQKKKGSLKIRFIVIVCHSKFGIFLRRNVFAVQWLTVEGQLKSQGGSLGRPSAIFRLYTHIKVLSIVERLMMIIFYLFCKLFSYVEEKLC